MVLKFERANGVRNSFDRVRLPMRIVVARINGPFVASAWMGGVEYPIQHGIAQIDIAGGHVYLGAQHASAIREIPCPHSAEQIEVLLHGAVAKRAVLARF